MPGASEIWAVFCQVDPSHPSLQRLVAGSTTRELERKATLISQDGRDTHVYLVASGRLQALRFSAKGDETWLADLEAGDLIGEISALEGERRTSSVVAVERSLVLSISRSLFLSEMLEAGPFGLAVARLLARRVKLTSSQLAKSVTLKVAGRLHGELISMANPVRESNGRAAYRIEGNVNVSSVAQKIYATREATSRAMTFLEDEGHVIRQGDKVDVFEPRQPLG